ncbi:MAG: LamG-like jellyroll fold domain-containing protein [Ruminococcus flavefaciens]
MISGYGFDSECSIWSQDRHAATDAILCGNAQWTKERTSAKGVVSLDGIGSYIELDNSVVKTDDLQISLGILWKGGSKVQDVFFAGDEKAYMRLTPSNENGVAEFTITDGKTTQSLTAGKALEKGTWSQVSVRIIDGKGELIINNKSAASADVSLTPLNVLSASENDNVYIGKSSIASDFNGAVDYCNFWFKPADEPDMNYSGKEEADSFIMGDVDLNGKFELNDAVILQHWLLTGKDEKLKSWEMGNFIPDNSLDVFDLTVMKRELLKH